MLWVVRLFAATVIVAMLCMGAVVHGQPDRPAQYEGQSLAKVLADLQVRGLRIIFSSEVVRPEMRVAAEPRRASLRQILDEILEPHGLIAQDGPGGSVLVVRNPRVRIERKPVETRVSTAPPTSGGQKASELVEIPRFVETVDVTGSQSWSAGVGAGAFVIQPLEVRSFAGGFDNVFRALQALPGVAATDDLGGRIAVRGASPDQNLTILDSVEIHNPYRIYVPSEDLGIAGLASAFNLETIESAHLSPGAFDVSHGDRLSSLLLVKSRDGSPAEAFQGASFVSLTDANLITEGKLPRQASGSWLVSARRTHLDLIAERVVDSALPSFQDVHAKVTWHPRVGQRVSLLGLMGRERIHASDDLAPDDEVHVTSARNQLMAVTFESTLGRRSSSRTIASYSNFDDSLIVSERSLSNSRGANTTLSIETGSLVEFHLARDVSVRDVALRQEFALRPSEHHAVDVGVEAHRLDTRWRWGLSGDRSLLQANGSSVRLGTSLPASLDSSRDSYRVGAWIQDRFQLGPRLVIQPGARVDRSSITGQTTLSPRLGVALEAGRSTHVTAAIRLHSQSPGYEKLFQSDYFVDLSSPSQGRLKAERAFHAVAGLQRVFGRGLMARVDAYYRRFSDLLVGRLETDAERRARLATYDVPPTLLASVPTRAEITTFPINAGTGNAYGVELYVAHFDGAATPLTGWGSYTFGHANRTAYGVIYPFDYDRRHAVSIATNLKLGPRIDVSTTARWSTGFPRTAVRGVRLALVPDVTDADGDGNRDERVPQRDSFGNPMFQPDPGDLFNLNAARLPQFARVDVRLSYRPTWSRERWAFYLDIMNVLNRKNVILIDSALVFDPRADRPGVVELREDTGIPFFPSFGIRFWF